MKNIEDSKILLVDDEESILKLLTTVLKKEGFSNVITSTNGMDGVKKCRENAPEIIILDIMLPDIDGFEVFRQIRNFSSVPIMFLSAKSEDTDKIIGLGLGADDYITKPFSPKEVALRVKAHLKRIEMVKKSLTNRENIIKTEHFTIDFEKGEIIKNDKSTILRAKELLLLKYLVENKNIILSKEKIVNAVWEDDYVGYDNTIMVHIRKLRQKLEDDPSNPKYILTVKGLGYKLKL
ncbi:DNA-binding response OmpR family regulator [Clostridium acetobutylicum]|uniref:Stage 0 sporulation protein A homolog n=1 Tax=Clostridium acetobutylicum (strain ATCC 824 / DSM 792 / JCM 1419 / IAM 19013 / LMG 5710 / NBRC 13948 / NRRL B-527 / VKM B-1787 / 2291 / W) TaxID=272562 RepID=Q97MA9_CLOAB|nr:MULTISPECIES: response regulator transcription factor [Clostridium]AAK78270.1 Response regulator (CheY domain, HTH domain) [Clostridium acetobutylicum ATCC 824]ADZ19337.1 Response regulator (CheY domain, HTH domain) [Clostridium acetobutylicum EA 2018]AEI31150.1 response regulator [Clostridium acetobutylicum DSM 1731]AWV82120.1 DNA-binding response regulator [Clostridium acetobutylicum]AWV82169.1 DNA-binding response regulator [Clostridium acetobutylicum]